MHHMGIWEVSADFLKQHHGLQEQNTIRQADSSFWTIIGIQVPRPSFYPLYTRNRDHIPILKGYKEGPGLYHSYSFNICYHLTGTPLLPYGFGNFSGLFSSPYFIDIEYP